jgi:hypothetical protein
MTWSMQHPTTSLAQMCWPCTAQQYGPYPHSCSSRSCRLTACVSVHRTGWQGAHATAAAAQQLGGAGSRHTGVRGFGVYVCVGGRSTE